MNDPFGEAIFDYFEKGEAPDLIVNSNYTDDEEIPVKYLFRSESEMPELERTALKLCKSKILDVGAAAGCHSLVLQNQKKDVTALELSELACKVLNKRSINKVVCSDVLNYSENKFDTILLLMNGAGIGKTLDGLQKLLVHLKSLLTEKGQILIDSSDIKYLFEEEDGSVWYNLTNTNYYGEMEYEVKYKNSTSTFKWLFVDFDKLKIISANAGLNCLLVEEGDNYEYLARLSL